MLTKTEYDKIIEEIVAEEQDRVVDSFNAIFEQEGHSIEVLILAFAQLVKDQPATIARIVGAIFERTGMLPFDP